MTWKIIGIMLIAMATPAAARDFLYPWKPGATVQQASDDQGACATQAKAGERQVNADEQARLRGQPAPPPPQKSRAAIASGLDGLRAFFNGYYDCLRDRGYSIRRMPSKEYRALKNQDDGMPVLAAMVAPTTPHAEVTPGTIK